jgi:preflagellin peptidase FlaK
MIVTYAITYLLWELKMWGGGDVRLFTAIATVIPIGLNIDFLNVFPQMSVYPFSFSVVINSILVSFPFLLIFVTYWIVTNDSFKENHNFALNVLNVENLMKIIHLSLNKSIQISDLKEGDIVNDFYFDDEHVADLINDTDGNLGVYENSGKGCKYYFKSLSAGGISKEEMYLIKIMAAQDFISGPISVKVAYPFTPAIFMGLIIAIFFGDIMMLFTKNLVLVV